MEIRTFQSIESKDVNYGFCMPSLQASSIPSNQKCGSKRNNQRGWVGDPKPQNYVCLFPFCFQNRQNGVLSEMAKRVWKENLELYANLKFSLRLTQVPWAPIYAYYNFLHPNSSSNTCVCMCMCWKCSPQTLLQNLLDVLQFTSVLTLSDSASNKLSPSGVLHPPPSSDVNIKSRLSPVHLTCWP